MSDNKQQGGKRMETGRHWISKVVRDRTMPPSEFWRRIAQLEPALELACVPGTRPMRLLARAAGVRVPSP